MGISLEKFRLVGQKIFAGPLLCVRPMPDPGDVARSKAKGPGPMEPTVWGGREAVKQANRQRGLGTGITGKKIKWGGWIGQLGPRWPVTWVVGKGLSQLPTGHRAHKLSLSTQWNATQPRKKEWGAAVWSWHEAPSGTVEVRDASHKRPLSKTSRPQKTTESEQAYTDRK